MPSFFPTAYPDELLYSIISRYHVMSSNTKASETLTDLFGNKSFSASIEFPKHLDEMCMRLARGQMYDSDHLIQMNTLLPLFLPFIAVDRAERAVRSMRSGEGSVHMILGVTGSVFRSPAYLRFCPKCVIEDENHFGVSYWHRTHQVTGVLACPIHHVRLLDSTISILSRRSQHAFVSLNSMKMGVTEDTCLEKASDHEIAMAQMVFEVLDQPPFLSLERLRIRYRARLKELGFLSCSGRIRRQELLESFQSFYGEDYLQKLNCSIDCKQKLNWLYRAFYDSEKQLFPIRHLLLMRYLGITFDEAFPSSVSVQIRSPLQSNKVPLPCISQLVGGQDRTDLERVQKKRDVWLQLLKRNPGNSRTELRKLSQYLYGWLEKNDREWFEEHLPSPIAKQNRSHERVNWVARDEDLSHRVAEAIDKMKRFEKPIRITIRAIGTYLGELGLFQKYLDRLPKTKAIFTPHLESVHMFQVRRAKSVALQMRLDGETITFWKLLYKARV